MVFLHEQLFSILRFGAGKALAGSTSARLMSLKDKDHSVHCYRCDKTPAGRKWYRIY
jgi:hypothetical protein